MTTIKYLQGSGGSGTGWEAKYYGISNQNIFEVLDSNNYVIRQIFYGTGLSGWSNSGHITGIDFFSSNGKMSTTLTGLDISMGEYKASFSIGNSSAGFWLLALEGNDTVLGSRFDDDFMGSKGSDTIDGGAGIDTLGYIDLDVAVNANLATGLAVTGLGTAHFKAIENLSGSSYADTLVGNGGNNVLQGFGGNDSLNGGLGFDTAVYRDSASALTISLVVGTAANASATDTLAGIEAVIGSRFDDTFTGSSRAETFDGFLGNDTINGGGGIDTAKYDYAVRSVKVDLSSGAVSGGAGVDVLSLIERVVGSDFNDTLRGSNVANTIAGGDGNDWIDGRGGMDVLVGGLGTDRFVFAKQTDTGTTGATADRIADFSHAQHDRIDLHTIDAMSGGTDDQFHWIAKAAFGHHKGELHYSVSAGNAYVSGDTDGNGAADFVIRLDHVTSLAAADFYL